MNKPLDLREGLPPMSGLAFGDWWFDEEAERQPIRIHLPCHRCGRPWDYYLSNPIEVEKHARENNYPSCGACEEKRS